MRLTLSMFLMLTAVLCSCMTPKERFLKQGAERLNQLEIREAYVGNTLRGQHWSAYYTEDGTRIVEVESSGTHVLKWWMSPGGGFCETTTNGGSNCNLAVYRKGNQYKVFTASNVYVFEVLPGNPLKLVE